MTCTKLLAYKEARKRRMLEAELLSLSYAWIAIARFLVHCSASAEQAHFQSRYYFLNFYDLRYQVLLISIICKGNVQALILLSYEMCALIKFK